jgi:carbon-monoxide dehydrogenase catalytic subunit
MIKGDKMASEKKKDEKSKGLVTKDVTICEATAQMLRKAERDGVETAFHRAASMKPCPIGAESACCKHVPWGHAG